MTVFVRKICNPPLSPLSPLSPLPPPSPFSPLSPFSPFSLALWSLHCYLLYYQFLISLSFYARLLFTHHDCLQCVKKPPSSMVCCDFRRLTAWNITFYEWVLGNSQQRGIVNGLLWVCYAEFYWFVCRLADKSIQHHLVEGRKTKRKFTCTGAGLHWT